MKMYEEKLNEIELHSEIFQEFISEKIDNLVNETSLTNFPKASKLSYVKDRLNLFINELNENF
jgi:hypothetical protein